MTSKSLIHERELSEALQAVINAATPAQRKTLERAMESYQSDFPEDYHRALGNILHFMLIDGHHYWPREADLRAMGKAKAKRVTR